MCCESLTGWLNFQLFPFDRDFFRVVSGMGSPKSLHVIRASEKKNEPKTLNHAFWRALKRLAQSLFSLPAYFLLQPPLPSAKRACPGCPSAHVFWKERNSRRVSGLRKHGNMGLKIQGTQNTPKIAILLGKWRQAMINHEKIGGQPIFRALIQNLNRFLCHGWQSSKTQLN